MECDDSKTCLRLLIDMQYELYAYIMALTGKSGDAEDVLQNTNLRILELASGHSIDGIANFRAWARKVAFFQVLTWRKAARRGRVLFDSELIGEVADQLADRASATDVRMTALEACIEKLPATLRAITEERYRPGGCVRRIAAKWQTTPHAITMNLYRVRLALKACIEKTLSQGESHV